MITQEQKSYEESNKKKQKVSAFLVNENKSRFFFVLFIFTKEIFTVNRHFSSKDLSNLTFLSTLFCVISKRSP